MPELILFLTFPGYLKEYVYPGKKAHWKWYPAAMGEFFPGESKE